MIPDRVRGRQRCAQERDFAQSSDDAVGRLLAVLAAAVPRDGRILEIGTGAGVALAWIVEGLAHRTDVEVVSIDNDEELVALVAASDWPAWVRCASADALELVPTLGRFDLVFADAVAGKWHGLDTTIEAVAPRGVLVVDDMAPSDGIDAEHAQHTARVRTALLDDPRLVAVELEWSSGVILATRREP